MSCEAIVGCILGTAVGDALGLPYEGVMPSRALRLLGPPDRYRFVFGRGMISDDTEHTCMVAQSLIEANGDADLFARRFAGRLRWWILALPAGVGKATARAGIKLWLGAKPANAGVFSAGNGPAMRAAIFGAVINDESLMLEFLRASSRLTHSDPKAEFGAIGTGIGLAMGNIPIGVAIGVALGVAIGSGIGAKRGKADPKPTGKGDDPTTQG